MIKSLDRKLLRDLWSMKGQMLAICLVMASGVGTFVMSLNTLESLQTSQADYYQQYRFADVFAGLKRAPRSLGDRIREIPGVDQLQTRVVMDVNLDVAGMPEPAVARLISIPERSRPVLNAPYLRSGRYLEPGRPGEVLASEAFAVAHNLKPGDRVDAIINGSKESLKIVGVAISPEYVYQLKGGDLFPDDRHFGVFWMGYEELSSAFDMEGGFNDLALSLVKGVSEREVIERLDLLIRPYGGLGAYGREEQLSHRFLSDELKGLRGTGLIVPLIFLAVAGFLLNVVMSRLIGTQREQIAALKAFGYTNWEVGFHYIKLVLLISVISAILGSIIGFKLGEGLTALYARFYRFPVFEFSIDLKVMLAGFLVSGVSGGVSVLGAVRRAVTLPPAEAMRPEPPASFRPTLLERAGLQRYLSQTMRIILRQIERKPVKTVLSCAGIAVAASLLVMGHSMNDSIEYMMDYQFFQTQRQDLTVQFIEPRGDEVRHEITRLPGVIHAELFRSVPVRLKSRHREKRIGLMGMEPDGSLNRLLDDDTQPASLPGSGLLLSTKLAEILRVGAGDRLTVEVLEGKRPVRETVVAGTVGGYTGVAAYMRLDALHRLVQEGRKASGAFVTADAREMEGLYLLLKEIPAVAGATVKETALRSFRDTIGENMLTMNFFNLLFACVIACGVVYNIARISLSERSHELATLRVIGFTRYEISLILLGELAVITLLAIPFGLALGYFFSWLVSLAYNTELYRVPFVLERATYGRAVVVILLAATASGLIVRRKLDRLDLVSVLKSYD